VHDPGDYAKNGVSRKLEPGMVLTVEPGLYFRPDGEGTPDSLAGIGVRIEDDVVVSEDGCEVLTRALPTSAEEVEALVGGGR
jgi:Xaa-Pro aminopeptidase